MLTSSSQPLRKRWFIPTLMVWVIFALLLFIPFIFALLSQQANQEIQQAQRAAANGEWVDAAQHMANAAASQPGRSDLWEQAGHYALLAGETQTAQTFLERAGIERLTGQGLIDLGDVYQENGDLPQAIRLWLLTLEKACGSGDAGEPQPVCMEQIYPRLFAAYRQGGDLSAGSAALRQLAEQHPEDAALQYQAGLFLAADQPQQAVDYLSKAARLDSSLGRRLDKLIQAILLAQRQSVPAPPADAPQSTPVEISPAYLYVASGRGLAGLEEWELARHAFTQAVRIEPDYAEAWAYLGEAKTHTAADDEERRQALADIQHALQLDPTSLPAHLFLAYYWTRQEQYVQARQTLEQAQAIDPDNPLLYAEMGNILALSGDLTGAYTAYARAGALAPDDPLYLRYLIRFSLTYNYAIEQNALPLARQAVILAPNDSETLDLMAQTLLRLGDLSNAERFARRALQTQPDYAPAHLSLGQVYLLRNQLDLARQEFETVLRLAPGSPSAELAQRLLAEYFS